jgi:hypothetical protein
MISRECGPGLWVFLPFGTGMPFSLSPTCVVGGILRQLCGFSSDYEFVPRQNEPVRRSFEIGVICQTSRFVSSASPSILSRNGPDGIL